MIVKFSNVTVETVIIIDDTGATYKKKYRCRKLTNNSTENVIIPNEKLFCRKTAIHDH